MRDRQVSTIVSTCFAISRPPGIHRDQRSLYRRMSLLVDQRCLLAPITPCSPPPDFRSLSMNA